MRRLQDRPRLLDLTWNAFFRMLQPFRRWLTPGGKMERVLAATERLSAAETLLALRSARRRTADGLRVRY